MRADAHRGEPPFCDGPEEFANSILPIQHTLRLGLSGRLQDLQTLPQKLGSLRRQTHHAVIHALTVMVGDGFRRELRIYSVGTECEMQLRRPPAQQASRIQIRAD